MIKTGIDKIAFHSSNYYLDLRILAEKRGSDPLGLGQHKMSMAAPGEDIVTLAANACAKILTDQDREQIETILFATESGLDCSKAAGIYLHKLLNLPERCRVLELKQACYSATGGLRLVLPWLRENPNKKILLVASDVARYALNSSGESSQGCGAVAMLLAANPRILAILEPSGIYTEDVMDFWRPLYHEEAIVDGKLSCELYFKALEKSWAQYQELSQRKFGDHARFCYHTPVPKLVERAHLRLAKINGLGKLPEEKMEEQLQKSLIYNREIGNCYSASLGLSTISLLENDSSNLSGKYLGLYSYGSGCVGEYFCGEVVAGYQKMLHQKEHQELLKNRQELSFAEYQKFYHFKLPKDGSSFTLPSYRTGKFRLKAINQDQPQYENV
jgi:hydroxymethylglutaryl-CoA synthase